MSPISSDPLVPELHPALCLLEAPGALGAQGVHLGLHGAPPYMVYGVEENCMVVAHLTVLVYMGPLGRGLTGHPPVPPVPGLRSIDRKDLFFILSLFPNKKVRLGLKCPFRVMARQG